jgi:DNA-binding protein H-NS
LSEKSKALKKVEDEKRLSEKIMTALPGFRGYKEKELRREADKLIRNHLYEKLGEARSDLKETYQKLVDNRIMETWTGMDRLIAKFDRISEKINHAFYGYSGFFDAIKIREDRLDRLIRFDSDLLGSINVTLAEVEKFKSEVTDRKFMEAKTRIEELMKDVEKLEETFNKRKSTILDIVEE